MRYILIVLGLYFVAACQPQNSKVSTFTEARSSDTFENYWYAGLAEVNTYRLKQNRYGAVHEGHATRIFVTEPMDTERQVKADNPEAAPTRTVLKMNGTRKFNTGVYPYSLMTSVFSPVGGAALSRPEKLTHSVQEWCGQTFLQLNLEESDRYRYVSYSYFGSEGDREGILNSAIPEDGLWNQIRLEPDALPVGSVNLVPAATYLRFGHLEMAVYSAEASLSMMGDSLHVYEVKYANIPRTVRIVFDASFPYVIRKWTEVDTESGRKTVAELMVSDRRAYWRQNGVNERVERKKLNLPENHQ